MHILALDVGISAVKAALVEVSSAEPVSPIVKEAYDLDHPTPNAAEIPPDRLWNAVTAAARWALRQVPDAGSAVAGVGLACRTPALVLLDRADNPLSPIWTHLDRRSRPVARQVWQTVGEEFLHTAGNRPLSGGITVISYRQQVNDDPYLTHRVRHFFHINSWLGLRLTGERAFDPGNASFTGLFNTVTDQQWSARWCDYFEVEPGWLPPILDGDTTLGQLRSQAAVELGLSPGLPVKLGLADTSSAIVFVNMTAGDLLHVAGTDQFLAALVDRPVPNPRLLTYHLGIGRQFVQVAYNPVGGVALNWLRNLCFRDKSEDVFFQETIPQAIAHKTPVVLDPPYLGGDHLQIEAHRAAFRELSPTTDRMDLLAALLNALVKHHREALRTLNPGQPFQRLFLTGGGADLIRQLIPEYVQAAVHQFKEASLCGVARLFSQQGPTNFS